MTREIEEFAHTADAVQDVPAKAWHKNFTAAYLARIRRSVDMRTIKKARFRIVVDPMYGAGLGYITRLLERTPVSVIEIHAHPDPLFGGLHPEPIEAHLHDLKKTVIATNARVGLATDGDADRIGVVDERGIYYPPHYVFPMLLYYLCRYKGLRGKVAQTISLGFLSERIAKDFNLPFEETPIGFKHIAERIISEKIMFGGEESGGYGYGTYMPERDGIMNSMMVIEMLAYTGKTLSSLRKEIEAQYGKSSYMRTDYVNPGIPKDEFVRKLKACAPSKIAGRKVVNIKDYDGIEFVLEDDSWLLLRPSGTEPLIRVYCESGKPKLTQKIITWGQKAVQNMLRSKQI
jgi:phosphomannomutase